MWYKQGWMKWYGMKRLPHFYILFEVHCYFNNNYVLEKSGCETALLFKDQCIDIVHSVILQHILSTYFHRLDNSKIDFHLNIKGAHLGG